jgi:hypothetical protein
MDQTNSPDAWNLAALGAAINVYVDRTLNNPQMIQSTTGYAVDSSGNLYQAGQPAPAQTFPPNNGGGGMQMLLLIGLVLLVANHG